MQYLIVFLEGIITFVSPCLLPMLPIYISFFAGQQSSNIKETADYNSTANTNTLNKTILNAIGFIIGFSIIFVLLGAFAGTIGRFLKDYTNILNIVTGAIVLIFGLNFLGIIKIGILNKTRNSNAKTSNLSFFSSILFGIVFSIGWTPCVGAFLGSALMLAANSGSSLTGILMLLCYSLGLGIPFFISAILIDRLKSTFDFIKKNYKIINIISGGFLVVIGILMMTGILGYYLSILTF